MTTLRAGRWTRVLGGAAALALCGLAAAQQPAAPEAAAESSRDVLARSVARLALFDLRAMVRPTDSDYGLAASLLDIARQMRPGDTDILRREIDAAYAAGDQPRVLELTRALVATPSGKADTVAVLRLISASISANTQTAEERLAAYERFLAGPQSNAFGRDIKSRLALDAALILRERGETDGFVAKLKQALELDPSHKEAAMLAATYFSERLPGDRVGRLTLLQNLLLSDPVDPNVHFSIARELAAGRAYKGAVRFHQNGIAIVSQQSAITAELDLERRILQWNVDGPTVMSQKIREQLAAERARAEDMVRRAKAAGVALDRVPKPEDVNLPMETATALALASDAAGDRDGVRAALNELSRSAGHALQGFEQGVRSGKLTQDQATSGAASITLALQEARLWTNQNVAEAQKDIQDSPGLAESRPDEYRVLTGWLALRTGDAPRAVDLLAPQAPQSASASAALGLAHEQLGRTAEAVASFQRAVDLAPLRAEGAWARTHLAGMGQKDNAAEVAALERAVAGIPSWVDEAIVSPWKFVDMKVALVRQNGEAGEDVPVRITIQNLSPIPLALGSDRPLNTRLLMVPKMDARQGPLAAYLRPEVVDLDRRLRLVPRESLTVEVNPDLGQTGWVIEALAGRPTSLRWRAIQGFQIQQGGGFTPGVMCVSAETDGTTRRPVIESSLTPPQLADRIATGASGEMPRLASLARWMVFDPMMFPPRGPDARLPDLGAVGQALAVRYPGLPPVERACVAALAPHARLSPAMAPLDEAMRAEQHPLPLSVVLATRVVDASDPALARAAGSPDEALRSLAAKIAERLGGKDPLYCRMSAGDFKLPAQPGAAPVPGAPAPGTTAPAGDAPATARPAPAAPGGQAP